MNSDFEDRCSDGADADKPYLSCLPPFPRLPSFWFSSGSMRSNIWRLCYMAGNDKVSIRILIYCSSPVCLLLPPTKCRWWRNSIRYQNEFFDTLNFPERQDYCHRFRQFLPICFPFKYFLFIHVSLHTSLLEGSLIWSMNHMTHYNLLFVLLLVVSRLLWFGLKEARLSSVLIASENVWAF